MHGFGWKCGPVDRSGTQAPPVRVAHAMPAPVPAGTPDRAAAPAMPAASPETADAAPPQAKPVRPHGLAEARGGKADNLQLISGVGPKLERTLQGLGFYHFDQIADWSRGEVQWVDEHLRFKGRIARDEWIAQARLLAAGDMDQFRKLYGSGGLKDKPGRSRSGSRTRKT